ncbi:hypothetical protein [Methylobacterium sp. A54F]
MAGAGLVQMDRIRRTLVPRRGRFVPGDLRSVRGRAAPSHLAGAMVGGLAGLGVLAAAALTLLVGMVPSGHRGAAEPAEALAQARVEIATPVRTEPPAPPSAVAEAAAAPASFPSVAAPSPASLPAPSPVPLPASVAAAPAKAPQKAAQAGLSLDMLPTLGEGAFDVEEPAPAPAVAPKAPPRRAAPPARRADAPRPN